MADTKISALSLATSIDGTEVAPIVQVGANKRATLATVRAYVVSDATLLKTSSIGVTVQPYDATTLKSSAIGTTVQAYDAGTVVDALYVHTDNNYSTDEKIKLSGIAAGAEVNVNADWLAVGGDAEILNKPTLAAVATTGAYADLSGKPTLGTAAAAATTDFATAAQGSKADTALQPEAIGVTVQAYDADLTSWGAIAPSAKQDTLVSGTNIKTVNGSSLLGFGDLTISGGGGTPGGATTQVQFNDAGVFAGDEGLAFNKTTGKLTVGGKTVTTSEPVLDLSQAWNNGVVTFTGIKFNVTNTVSAAASMLMDLQVGGVSKFNVRSDGSIFPQSVRFSGTGSPYLSQIGNNQIGFTVNNVAVFSAIASGSTGAILITASGGEPSIRFNNDTYLQRDGVANAIAQRNGNNAQTFRLYGTYTSEGENRRLSLSMSATGVAAIKPEGAGIGATGNMLHISGLPTSNPGPGILWNNGGVVNVGT